MTVATARHFLRAPHRVCCDQAEARLGGAGASATEYAMLFALVGAVVAAGWFLGVLSFPWALSEPHFTKTRAAQSTAPRPAAA